MQHSYIQSFGKSRGQVHSQIISYWALKTNQICSKLVSASVAFDVSCIEKWNSTYISMDIIHSNTQHPHVLCTDNMWITLRQIVEHTGYCSTGNEDTEKYKHASPLSSLSLTLHMNSPLVDELSPSLSESLSQSGVYRGSLLSTSSPSAPTPSFGVFLGLLPLSSSSSSSESSSYPPSTSISSSISSSSFVCEQDYVSVQISRGHVYLKALMNQNIKWVAWLGMWYKEN